MEADYARRLSDEHLANLERQYGRIKYVEYNGIPIVFRKPKRHECQQHALKLETPQEKVHADDQLAQLLVIHCGEKEGAEAKKAFTELLDDYPYLTRNEKVGGALAKLTGVVQDDEAKSYGAALTANAAPTSSMPKA